jgi:hypothetical protein
MKKNVREHRNNGGSGGSADRESLTDKSRRRAVKILVSGVGGLAAYQALPSNWTTPLIEQVFLPAHAATSARILSDPCTLTWLEGYQDDTSVTIRVDGFVTPPTANVQVQIEAYGTPESSKAIETVVTDSEGIFSATLTLTTTTGIGAVHVVTTASGAVGQAMCSLDVPTKGSVPDVPKGEVTFSFTGGDESFTVPDKVTAVTITAIGGSGGGGGGGGAQKSPGTSGSISAGDGGIGSSGEEISTQVSVTPGDILTVFVGEGGKGGQGGRNRPLTIRGGAGGERDGDAGDNTFNNSAGAGGGSGGSSEVSRAGASLVRALGSTGGGGGGFGGIFQTGSGNGGAGENGAVGGGGGQGFRGRNGGNGGSGQSGSNTGGSGGTGAFMGVNTTGYSAGYPGSSGGNGSVSIKWG